MVGEPPVGVECRARHRGHLLAYPRDGKARRPLREAQDHQGNVAGEEVHLHPQGGPDEDGADPEFGLRYPEGLLYPPELPVGIEYARVRPSRLAGADEVVAVVALCLGD